MISIHNLLRDRLLREKGLLKQAVPLFRLESLERSEWCSKFEQLQRNRLIMGALRYGRLGAPGKPQFDRIGAIVSRAKLYQSTGNQELLVDIANLALVEFVEGNHPNKHFSAGDDGDHVRKVV